MDNVLRKLRRTMLETAAVGHDGNLQSCFSSLEILWTLYNYFLPNKKSDCNNENVNKFVLSKGQSNLALMTVLAEKGLLEETELDTFCKFDSRISMQADRTKFDSIVETSAGSLGHGFPIAVGMAWAKKIKNHSGRIFCLAGDGEMNEGTMWEAMFFAASERLNNLTLIIDDNNSINDLIEMGSLSEKMSAFGFDVFSANGHNVDELRSAFSYKTDKPCAVLAKTVRGYGSQTLMNDKSWFHRYPKIEELNILFEEVNNF